MMTNANEQAMAENMKWMNPTGADATNSMNMPGAGVNKVDDKVIIENSGFNVNAPIKEFNPNAPVPSALNAGAMIYKNLSGY